MKTKQIDKLKRENKFLFAATLILFILFITVFFTSIKFNKEQEPADLVVLSKPAELSKEAILLKVPAVDRQGKGVSVSLAVEAREGNGKTLIDIESLFFFTDTQESILTAKKVSSDLTGLNLNNYDITYEIYADANSIGGPSAGTALAIATIAALQNLQIREDVMITGRLFPDGAIGEVSSVLAKAQAAKEVGATILLVPLKQGEEIVYETTRICETKGIREICTIEKVPVTKNIGEKVGIQVIEVETIQEALDYFLLS